MIHNIYDRPVIDLNGMWRYKLDQNDIGVRQSYYLNSQNFNSWQTIKVPHNWYLEEEIGDYFGTIWYERGFAVPSLLSGKRLFLNFEGIDYISEVWLNGKYLGFHEGMFDSFEYEVTDIVKFDEENILIVRDSAPKDPTDYILADPDATPLSTPYKYYQSKGIKLIKGHMIEAMHRPGSMTSFRQDGNSGGIWGSANLVVKPEVCIDYIKAFTHVKILNNDRGELTGIPDNKGLAAFDVYINSSKDTPVVTEIILEVKAYNFDDSSVYRTARNIEILPGDNVFKLAIIIPDVKLWWTWDHGRPNMYTATIRLKEDEAAVNIGIKDIKADDKGQWYLNGKKIFLRGMRYISSLWMSEANEEMWKKDFDKMLDMDINSIRIGSHVEKDGLYTLCDELGLLMWQVFPLHYCIDDGDDVIDRASDMMLNMGLMLNNHACMGMWSVYKEPEIYGLDDKPNVYFKLCEVLRETLSSVDPIRWVHKGDYREGVQNIMIGSCQDGDMDILTTEMAPNIVEFGADSVPCLKTLKKFIPEDKLWPPDWDTWEYWGLFYRNQFKRAKVEMGSSLEEFIHNTQAYEALVVKEQIEILRQRKYRPVSTMYLYYWSDACPMMGSGLLDYYREEYEVYKAMKGVYTQVLISLEWNKDPYVIGRTKKYVPNQHFIGKLHVNNDHYHSIEEACIEWEIKRASSEDVLVQNSFYFTLPPDSVIIVDEIDWIVPDDYIGDYIVKMSVKDKDKNILSTNNMTFRACCS